MTSRGPPAQHTMGYAGRLSVADGTPAADRKDSIESTDATEVYAASRQLYR